MENAAYRSISLAVFIIDGVIGKFAAFVTLPEYDVFIVVTVERDRLVIGFLLKDVVLLIALLFCEIVFSEEEGTFCFRFPGSLFAFLFR